jgi:hypothetical protein
VSVLAFDVRGALAGTASAGPLYAALGALLAAGLVVLALAQPASKAFFGHASPA